MEDDYSVCIPHWVFYSIILSFYETP
uniref:Uncharacterized protein n=1 Tax=Lepeophtheirus salmonis TaxID=72036 RepID=A0A0K2UCX6_LEPSM